MGNLCPHCWSRSHNCQRQRTSWSNNYRGRYSGIYSWHNCLKYWWRLQDQIPSIKRLNQKLKRTLQREFEKIECRKTMCPCFRISWKICHLEWNWNCPQCRHNKCGKRIIELSSSIARIMFSVNWNWSLFRYSYWWLIYFW